MISHSSKSFKYPDYISPLPADEFIKLAEKKQQMYDEGVSKVRNTLDQYSNLRGTIKTEAEQKYFDEAMNNLVKSINSNAGLDFSYKSNVDAVINMGRYIEKDDNIITAVNNGKEIQRRAEVLSKLDSKKRSAANDFFFMQDAQEYQKANTVGKKIAYGKGYEEYYDISEKWNEFMKSQKVTPSTTSFATSEQGSPYGPAYILKRTEEGYSEADIAKRFRAFLSNDPKALRQLNIDASYNLAQLGKEGAYEGFIQHQTAIAESSEVELQKANSMVSQLEKAYRANPSNTIKENLTQAKANLDYFKQARALATQKMNTPFEEFNPQEYANIYQDKFIANASNMYAGKKVTDDLIGNKYWEEQQKNNRLYLQHDLALKRESAKIRMQQESLYRGTVAEEVVVPQMNTLLKNLNSNTASQFLKMREFALQEFSQNPTKGTPHNLNEFVKGLSEAQQLTGTAQIAKIKSLIKNHLTGGKINWNYKKPIAAILGFKANSPEEYDNQINAVLNEMDQFDNFVKRSTSVQPGEDPDMAMLKPFSFANEFNSSVGNLGNFNFLLNSNRLTDRYGVGLPASTSFASEPVVDAMGKVVLDQETGKPIYTTKKSTNFKNTINKGPKVSTELDFSSLDID